MEDIKQHKKPGIIYPTIIVFSILIVLLMMPERISFFDDGLNFNLSLIAIVNVLVFWFGVKKTYRSWLRFDTLFLIGYLIVHTQVPFLASIGIEPERPSFVWINKNVVNYASWISTMALLLWLLGYLLFMRRNQKPKKQAFKKYTVSSKSINNIMVLLFLLFLGLVGADFLGGNYKGTENWGSGATYVFLLLQVVLYLNIIYFFINTKNLSFSNILKVAINNKALFGVTGSYVLLFLLIGDRGPVMQVGILILGGYTLYQKPITFVQLFTLMAIGAFIFTLIGLGRNTLFSNDDSNILVRGYKNLATESSGFNPTNELATSNRILYRAIDVVPYKHPHLYGLTMFTELIGIIPFGGATFINITNLPKMYYSSSLFFTIIGQGPLYTYGEGSEIIGDLYINIGMYGALIVMFLFGYFISFFSIKAIFTKQHTYIIIYLLLLITAIYLNRSHILMPLKFIVYALIVDRLLTKRIYE